MVKEGKFRGLKGLVSEMSKVNSHAFLLSGLYLATRVMISIKIFDDYYKQKKSVH